MLPNLLRMLVLEALRVLLVVLDSSRIFCVCALWAFTIF
jgi:hypothetical protein